MSTPPSLANVLSISIVLRNIIWYLPFSTLCRLLQTSKAVREALYSSPDAWRYIDVSRTSLANCCATIWNTVGCGNYGHQLADCIRNDYRCKSVDDAVDGDDQDADYGHGVNDVRWLTRRMREPLSQEAFINGPARSVLVHLGRSGILQHVQALILDNAYITADFIVNDILKPIDYGRLSIRLLSIGRANLSNAEKLAMMLKDYALTKGDTDDDRDITQPIPRKKHGSRETTKGLYIFDKPMLTLEHKRAQRHRKEEEMRQRLRRQNASSNRLEGNSTFPVNEDPQSAESRCTNDTNDLWYERSGVLLHDPIPDFWVETLEICAYATGALAFDAVLCRGPRHDKHILAGEERFRDLPYIAPKIATIALGPDGCSNCGFAPEGFVCWDLHETTADIPLLRPLPRAAITVRNAKRPSPQYFGIDTPEKGHGNGIGSSGGSSDSKSKSKSSRTIMRCRVCLKRRMCSVCSRWWCEYCHDPDFFNFERNAREIAEEILHNNTPNRRRVTSNRAYEIALNRYLRLARLAKTDYEGTYMCTKYCLRQKVFVPLFGE